MMLKPLLLSAALCLATLGPALAQDPTINYEVDDPAMGAAIAAAQATLPLFLDHAFDDAGYSVEGAAMKVALPADGSNGTEHEHIWVAPFARASDGSLTGILANEPVALGALRAGDQIDFTPDMISDWHLTAPNGLFWGSYTSRVMYDQGAFGDTPFDQVFQAEPVPEAWR